MGQSTVQVKNIYHEYGFQTDEVPDHIAVELEFLAMLSTLSTHDPVQQDYDFLLNHLRQWAPEFFKQVERSDDIGFYKEVSRYARQVIFCFYFLWVGDDPHGGTIRRIGQHCGPIWQDMRKIKLRQP